MFTYQFNKYCLTMAATMTLVFTLVLSMFWQTSSVTAQNNQEPKWSVNAMACVPNGSTTQNNMVQTSHGHARYTEGKTGDLYLICPFTDASLNGTVVQGIEMTYRGGSVSASLKMIDKQSGEIFLPLQVSNGNCLTDTGQFGNPYLTCIGANISAHQLDFYRYYYYIQFSLNRTSSSDDVRIVGASIW